MMHVGDVETELHEILLLAVFDRVVRERGHFDLEPVKDRQCLEIELQRGRIDGMPDRHCAPWRAGDAPDALDRTFTLELEATLAFRLEEAIAFGGINARGQVEFGSYQEFHVTSHAFDSTAQNPTRALRVGQSSSAA